MTKKLRQRFWRALGLAFARMARFCRNRQARLCGCAACYLQLNGQRLAREAIEQALRDDLAEGKPPIDRRPS